MKNVTFFWMALVALALVSCKPNQAVTKAAYEKAMAAAVNKPVITADTPTDGAITEIQPMVTQSTVARERSESVKVLDNGTIGKYSVVVGTFKQRTNANSMRDRFISDGYAALVVQNAQGLYRVVACSYDTKEEAVAARIEITKRYPSSYIKEPWLLIQQ
ncbi:MAG: SPOR domain-containing protein [Bacteroidaceae bacterium]|nr:SPOR domain-containing protein [Bacteroidaceae bacterium]